MNTNRFQASREKGQKMCIRDRAIGSEEIWMDQEIASTVIEKIAKEMEHYYEK